MRRVDLWKAVLRVACSTLCGGVSYFVWLAVFLLTARVQGSVLRTIVWVLTPVATAAGFAGGITIGERLTRIHRTRFLHIFAWPLAGCTIGAAAVYWFGPMLIVFGMFAAGTLSIVLREAVAVRTNKGL